ERKWDRHITALDEARFVQALAERGHDPCAQLRHTGIDKPNPRHRRLLRARRERPRRRAAEQRDELAPIHRARPRPKDHGKYTRLGAVHRSKSGPSCPLGVIFDPRGRRLWVTLDIFGRPIATSALSGVFVVASKLRP